MVWIEGDALYRSKCLIWLHEEVFHTFVIPTGINLIISIIGAGDNNVDGFLLDWRCVVRRLEECVLHDASDPIAVFKATKAPEIEAFNGCFDGFVERDIDVEVKVATGVLPVAILNVIAVCLA